MVVFKEDPPSKGLHTYMLSCSIVSDFLQPYGLYPTRLFCSWIIQARILELGYHFFLVEIFPTQESNPYLLHLVHWKVDSLLLSHMGKPQLRSDFFVNTHTYMHMHAHAYTHTHTHTLLDLEEVMFSTWF